MTDITTLIAQIRAWQAAEQKFLQLKGELGFENPQTRAAVKRLDTANEALGLGNTYFYRSGNDDAIGKFIALADEIERLQKPFTLGVNGNESWLIVGILKRLVRARVQAGLSQSQAAKLIGLSAGSTISHYESGARELSVMTLLELCKIYDVSVVWVMTGGNPHFTDEQRQQVIDHWQKNVNLAVNDLHKTLDLLESLRQE